MSVFVRALFVCLLLPVGANAAVIINAVESGGDVIFSTEAGGTLDLTGLTFFQDTSGAAQIVPSFGVMLLSGSTSSALGDNYKSVSGPSNFGSGSGGLATSASGDYIGLTTAGRIGVPDGYISGTPINSTAIWAGQTLQTLGISPGTYVWSWSSDSVTLNVSAVPLPAAAWLFGSAVLGLGIIKRRNK